MEKNQSNKIEALRLSNDNINTISKESLYQALIYLLSEKDFEKITITELVKKAGVSRATFYRNYNSKTDLVNNMIKRLSDELKNITKDFTNFENCEKFYLLYFNKCKENQRLISALFKINVPVQRFIAISSTFERPVKVDKEKKYKFLAFEGAFFSIFNDWVNSDFENSPEEMAKLCMDLFGDVRKLLFK